MRRVSNLNIAKILRTSALVVEGLWIAAGMDVWGDAGMDSTFGCVAGVLLHVGNQAWQACPLSNRAFRMNLYNIINPGTSQQ